MGYNTAVMVLNDHLDTLSKRDFGNDLNSAIASAHRDGGKHNSFAVLPSQHADTVQVVLVGRNDIRSLGFSGHWEEEAILKDVARAHGYRLVKVK